MAEKSDMRKQLDDALHDDFKANSEPRFVALEDRLTSVETTVGEIKTSIGDMQKKLDLIIQRLP